VPDSWSPAQVQAYGEAVSALAGDLEPPLQVLVVAGEQLGVTEVRPGHGSHSSR
jgi:hypothetical protein